jgi:hypothetical protein
MPNCSHRLVTVALMTAHLCFSVAALAATPVSFVCSGPKVDAARKVAKDNNLTLGMDPKACFGEMQLTESARKQIVVAVPSAQCKAGKLLDVYDRSRGAPGMRCSHSRSAAPQLRSARRARTVTT